MAKIPGVPDVVNQTVGNEKYGKGEATGAVSTANVNKINTDSAFAASEVTRAQNVIAERQKAGLDTSAQQKYLSYVSGVVSKNNKPTVVVNQDGIGSGAVVPDGKENGDKKEVKQDTIYTNMVTNTNSSGEEAKKSAKAALEIALQDQLTSLEKTYQDAVANGEISVRDAKDAYDKQAAALNKQYYQESKNASLYSEQMGIQNSNQSLGQQASASERNIANVNQNAMVRNKAVNDIKTTLNNLRTKTDLDITSAKANYASSLIKSDSDINMNVLNQLNQLGMWKGDQLFQTSEREASQQFQTNERVAGQDFTSGENQKNREFTTSERLASQTFTSGENKLDRNLQTTLQNDQQSFTSGQNALDRTQQTTLQNDQQAFQAGQNSLDRSNSVKVAGINNSNKNSYQTPDNVITSILTQGFKKDANGKWTKDGGKTTFDTPEAALGSLGNNLPDDVKASLKQRSAALAEDVSGDVIKNGGDFSSLNPNSVVKKDTTWVGKYVTGTYGAANDAVKKYNAQVKAYTKYYNSLNEDEKKIWKKPPTNKYTITGGAGGYKVKEVKK